MISRMIAALFSGGLVLAAVATPVSAQSNREVGEMRLYIQQLEEQIRHLTGENEQLRFQLRQMQAGTGGQLPGRQDTVGQVTGGQVTGGQLAGQDSGSNVGGTINRQNNASVEEGAPMQDLGTLSVSPDDPLIAPDGAGVEVGGVDDLRTGQPADQPLGGGGEAPLDLSALAGGQAGSQDFSDPGGTNAAIDQGELPADQPSAGQPQDSGPELTASISGSARDEYDLAYGYILTGDFRLAEAHFSAWLSAFPTHNLADDARFWLAESNLRQGKNQEAASGFLDLHKRVPNNNKGPDTLMKLGVALAGLGEKAAACATFSEVAKKYPDASGATMNRVAGEQQRAQC